MPIRWHLDDPALLREAIGFTAAEIGFTARLVERDYFCSVVLEYLATCDAGLTFKGGTCLTKIYGSLYRLSEDLDFSISTSAHISRTARSRSMKPVRSALDALPERLTGFRILEPLSGTNNSTQYNATVGYASLLERRVEPVGIEVGVREPTLLNQHKGVAKTALLNPVNRRDLVEAYPVNCLAYQEAMAEKLRAALCRREIAIRDFFDVDHAVRSGGFDPLEVGFLDLLRRKLEIPRTGAVDVTARRMEQLRRQLDAQLRPVLREQEFATFDLQRAMDTIRRVAQELARR